MSCNTIREWSERQDPDWKFVHDIEDLVRKPGKCYNPHELLAYIKTMRETPEETWPPFGLSAGDQVVAILRGQQEYDAERKRQAVERKRQLEQEST